MAPRSFGGVQGRGGGSDEFVGRGRGRGAWADVSRGLLGSARPAVSRPTSTLGLLLARERRTLVTQPPPPRPSHSHSHTLTRTHGHPHAHNQHTRGQKIGSRERDRSRAAACRTTDRSRSGCSQRHGAAGGAATWTCTSREARPQRADRLTILTMLARRCRGRVRTIANRTFADLSLLRSSAVPASPAHRSTYNSALLWYTVKAKPGEDARFFVILWTTPTLPPRTSAFSGTHPPSLYMSPVIIGEFPAVSRDQHRTSSLYTVFAQYNPLPAAPHRRRLCDHFFVDSWSTC